MRRRCWLPVLLLVAVVVPVRGDEPPAGWTATVSESFDREPYTLTGPPEAARQRDYTRFALTRCADARVSGASARWQVQPRAGLTEAALVLTPGASLDGLAVWVKNPLEHAVQLACRVTDDAGRTFRTAPRALGLTKGWFRYVFPFDELLTADPAPQLPYRTTELVLSGLQSGADYTLYLDELCLLQAPPPHLQVLELTAPMAPEAGQTLTVQVAVAAPPALLRPVNLSLSLERAGMAVVRRSAGAMPRRGRFDLLLPVPRHLAGGPYQLKLSAQGAELSGLVTRDLTLTAGPPPATVEVRPAAQGGTFAVDGVALPWIGGWWRGDALPQHMPWLMVPLTCDFDYTGQLPPVWLAPDKFDYTSVHTRLAAALGANPEAYLIPIIHISSPPWWDAQHPGELMVFGDNQSRLPATLPVAKRTFASWASPVWRRDAGAALTRLIRHLEDSPWGPAIIGYQLASGDGGRWVYPGAAEGLCSDYSVPQQEAFRAWLKNKYKDVATLRVAWGQPARPVTTPEALKVTRPIMGWNQARIPAMARRTQAPSGVLHDPTVAQEIVDYQIFSADEVADTIRTLARQAREASGGKKLMGAAYGHLFDLAATRAGLQNGGHLALAPLCAAEELDFLASPGSFGESANPPLPTTVAASLSQHGKLWVAQGDAAHGATTLAGAGAWGGAAALEARPEAPWLARLESLPPTLPRSGPAEIAIVVDDISAAYTACGSDLVKPLLSDQRLGLALMGAPYDVWTLDDVLGGLAVGYRMYVFLDAFYLDANARQQLVAALGQQPCTAVWIYGAGALDADMSLRTMRELIGLTLIRPLRPVPGAPPAGETEGPAPRTDKGPLQVKVGGADGYVYGASVPVTPRFGCWDSRADVRGTLLGTAYGGLAVVERGGVKSVWSGAPHLPASLLRSIALDADVHLYGESGVGVYCNRNLLVVRASADGEQRVRLPRLAEVYDLATGRPVGPAATEFVTRMRAGEIRFYYWGAAPLAAP